MIIIIQKSKKIYKNFEKCGIMVLKDEFKGDNYVSLWQISRL